MIMPVITLRRKRIIIDVDTQKYFFLDNGVSRVRDHRQVLANILRVVAWARLKNIRMISTVQDCFYDYHYRNFCTADIEDREKINYTLRNRHTSFDATDCTDLPPEILKQYDQVILHKRCFDPFAEPRAERMLTELQANEFILIGATTEGAVKATALGLLARQKNVTLLADAIGSRNEDAADITLRHIWAKGAKIIDTKTLLRPCCLRPTEIRYCDHH